MHRGLRGRGLCLHQAEPGEGRTPHELLIGARSEPVSGLATLKRRGRHFDHLRRLKPKHFIANNSLVDLDIEAGKLDDALAFAEEV